MARRGGRRRPRAGSLGNARAACGERGWLRSVLPRDEDRGGEEHLEDAAHRRPQPCQGAGAGRERHRQAGGGRARGAGERAGGERAEGGVVGARRGPAEAPRGLCSLRPS